MMIYILIYICICRATITDGKPAKKSNKVHFCSYYIAGGVGVNKCIEFIMNGWVMQWLIDASTWESEHKMEILLAGLREDVTYPLDTTCTNKVVNIVKLLFLSLMTGCVTRRGISVCSCRSGGRVLHRR